MFSFKMLLFALTLTLLAVTVQSWSDGNLSGPELTRLYNSPVYEAERLKRPKGSSSSAVGPFSHSGVRVTLGDRSKWLIHKGMNYGTSSQTVVTRADYMSSNWKVVKTGNFQGRKTVGDFVATGGSNYDFLFDNCHWASIRMMNQ
ncbi:hypothetical protein EPR50_G00058680 [Perca flavescens]|uniref:Uncharacterized protein n=1 Tax=Perca flavescens TaxID=8167 RepID=A0A484D9J1_PERFV|nr:hypothetical protein EPR50_G00058680 [Perca flavescens]